MKSDPDPGSAWRISPVRRGASGKDGGSVKGIKKQ